MTMRRSNSGAARMMPFTLVDRGNARAQERPAAVPPRGLTGSSTRLSILPVCITGDSSLADDLASVFDVTSGVAIVDALRVVELRRDSLSRRADDVVLLDARR